MALFGAQKSGESFVLIDICSTSVAGGLVHTDSRKSTVYFTERLSIKYRPHEDAHTAMLRTLEDLASKLLTQGAPILRKETGSGHISRIFVSVSAPWQKTSVRTEHINPAKPFVFTKAIVTDTIQKTTTVPEGYAKSGESLIATILNGYEISRPYGKHVARADLVVLTSFIEKNTSNEIENVLRKTYHTHALTVTGFAPVAYSAFRTMYPHEKDFLVMHVGSEATEIAIIKRGLLVNVTSVAYGTNSLLRIVSAAGKNVPHTEPRISVSLIDPIQNDQYKDQVNEAKRQWLQLLQKTLQEISTQHALPRTLFLLADEESRDYLRNALDAQSLRTLWLTEEPLRIIALTPKQFSTILPYQAQAEGDIFLSLLALYAQNDHAL
jgi:hypothetical protein